MKRQSLVPLVLFAFVFSVILGAGASAQQQTTKKSHKQKQSSTQQASEKEQPQQTAAQYKEDLFNGMKWRLIGPFRGGRAVALAGIPGDPTTYYFGGAAGGVFKSTDSGENWTPVFDKEPTASIGAIAVADSNPNVIYVGSGEPDIRGNLASGNGVYKSVDGGKTWNNVGLKDSQHIGAVIIDPQNPDRVFVAALGHTYGPNPERGIYRTLDGGKTWERVLYKDDKTGGVDLTFDPHNSNVLYAALWQVQRTPWSLDSGGPGSGLYKSNDGGTTWKQLTGNGLPKGDWGRIGVSVSGADGNRVYALIEAKEGGIYSSSNGGDRWDKVNDDERYRQRAWYFSKVFADPQSVDTVYVVNTGLFRSTDGGKTFDLLPAPHGDHHILWIDPKNPKRLFNGNDGGVDISTDGGKTWTRQDNQPTAQFYHVIADNRFQYHLYGAQQDNSTVGIASRTDHGTIDQKDWEDVGGGESGYIAPYPPDPDIVYAGDGGGVVTRYDMHNRQEADVSPYPLDTSGHGAADTKFRFQWTEPIVISPHDPNTIYTAANVVFKSTDGGMSWKQISEDLTRNDKSKQQPSGGPITLDITSVEYYDTVFTLAESPLQKDLLWAGTDDGLIWISQDGGAHWSNVTPKALPEWSMVSMIEASPFEAGTAFAAVDRHKLDDMKPYIFRTTDFGKTWERIDAGIPDTSFVHAVRQDPKDKNLLFAATENTVYASFDNGAHWQSIQLNLPNTPVTDAVVHGDDLAISTNGRAFWVLDDITPLRQLTPQVANADVVLYQPQVAYRWHFPEFFRPRGPVGSNPPPGAIIDYFLKTEPKDAKLEIFDAQGKLVRSAANKEKRSEQPPEWPDQEPPTNIIPAHAGMNRYAWNLRHNEPTQVPGAFYAGFPPVGPTVMPGNYTIKLTVDGKTYSQPLELKMDPRVKVSEADLQKQTDLAMNVNNDIDQLHKAMNQIKALHADITTLKSRFGDDAKYKPVVDAMDAIEKKIQPVEEKLYQTKLRSSEGNLRYPNELNESYDSFSFDTQPADTAPTQGQLEVYNQLHSELETQLAAWKQIASTDVPALNDTIQKAGVPLVNIEAGVPGDE